MAAISAASSNPKKAAATSLTLAAPTVGIEPRFNVQSLSEFRLTCTGKAYVMR